jgi:tripartite-type tricarboxylate transporter receptor subunit TctC
MPKPLGRTVVVKNRPSAGVIRAPEGAKGAKPNGYTILISSRAPTRWTKRRRRRSPPSCGQT